MRLFHPAYGYLSMAEGQPGLSNQWQNYKGTRYGTFIDGTGQFLALPLDTVTVE